MYKVSQKSKVFERFRSSDEDYVTITWERNVHIKRKSKNKLESLSPISKRIVQVLENLIQESDFTLADLNQLQQVLEEKKAEAVETVPCNCM